MIKPIQFEINTPEPGDRLPSVVLETSGIRIGYDVGGVLQVVSASDGHSIIAPSTVVHELLGVPFCVGSENRVPTPEGGE
jgi:hypothetical protein